MSLPHNHKNNRQPVALTIAGSDSSAGAGIQVDLRVFSTLGVFGSTAITAITAQNPTEVRQVEPLASSMVQAQIYAVAEALPVKACKTGMLWSAKTIESIAEMLARGQLPQACVVDPVMVSTSGSRLIETTALNAYRDHLLPRAALCTPNLDEARTLLDNHPGQELSMEAMAQTLHHQLGCPILLKGGHCQGNILDVLVIDGKVARIWQHDRAMEINSHGSGCALSAAITAFLAQGHSLIDACNKGIGFIQACLHHPLRAGQHLLLGIESASCQL